MAEGLSQGNQLDVLAQGAEAIIYLKDNMIVKDRISKYYRIKELDDKIRKRRTKSEKKLLEKASKIINAPDPFPLKEEYKIKMPFIDGKKLSEHLDSFSIEEQKEICKIIGEEIAKLHAEDIIHGDLTTSNMILKKGRNITPDANSKKSLIKRNLGPLYLIDFGLGFISKKIEDKAVDLHLLKQALEAKHFKNWEVLFEKVKEGYSKYSEAKKVFERIVAIERRGRYRH